MLSSHPSIQSSIQSSLHLFNTINALSRGQRSEWKPSRYNIPLYSLTWHTPMFRCQSFIFIFLFEAFKLFIFKQLHRPLKKQTKIIIILFYFTYSCLPSTKWQPRWPPTWSVGRATSCTHQEFVDKLCLKWTKTRVCYEVVDKSVLQIDSSHQMMNKQSVTMREK